MHTENARVVSHETLGGGYRRLSMACPAIVGDAKPGQFVHFRIPEAPELCLRRPFSIYRAEGAEISVLYKEVGEGTRAMASIGPGDEVSVIGPLGNGYPEHRSGSLPVLVAGGYGVAPLSFLAKQMPDTGIVFVGGRAREDILCVEDFTGMDWPVKVATEDGSDGERGLVTDLLDHWLDDAESSDKIEFFACGPEGMLKAVAERALARGCPSWISLDRHMGCGVGVCLACVQLMKSDGGRQEWARTCKDGPVFDGSRIVW